jgi:hypothetical protein
MMDAAICCWGNKYYFHYPRPSGADPEIKTLLGVPNFPSYTSGHSTFSGSACTVLSYLFPEGSGYFTQLANDASNSGKYACIHFSFDCTAGLTCGVNIGGYTVSAAQADGAN